MPKNKSSADNGKDQKGGVNETFRGLKIVLEKLKTIHKLGEENETIKKIRELMKIHEK